MQKRPRKQYRHYHFNVSTRTVFLMLLFTGDEIFGGAGGGSLQLENI